MTEGVSVGICDDVLLWREEITDKVLAYQTEKQIQITIKQYSCAEDYLKAQDDIDILFLDIEMSGMSGIALKDILIQNKRKEMLAFITCYDGYLRFWIKLLRRKKKMQAAGLRQKQGFH